MIIIPYYTPHRWWNKCVDMINHQLSIEHDNLRILKKAMLPWYRYECIKKGVQVYVCIFGLFWRYSSNTHFV